MGPEHKIISKSEDIMENKFQETTESSSSFDDDVSGRESGSAFGDDEFVSDFGDDATSGLMDDLMMRKKPLTAHWMTYIQPIRWRCKWVELQMWQLKRLEHKYTRELVKYNQNELQKVEDGEPDRCSREISFSGGHRRDRVLTRKRRKRNEDTEDTGTYMSKHNLFSFYTTDNKKVPAEEWGNKGIKFDDEFGPNEQSLFLKTRDGDEDLEQVLRKIFSLTEHVSKLKIRLEKVMSGIADAEQKSLLVPCNALTSSAKHPASALNNRDRMAVESSHNASRLISKHNMGDVHLRDIATMSPGEFEDDILIYNDKIVNGMNGFEDFNVESAERPKRTAKKCNGTAAPRVSEEPEMLCDEQPAPKTRSIAQLTASSTRKSQRGHTPRRHF